MSFQTMFEAYIRMPDHSQLILRHSREDFIDGDQTQVHELLNPKDSDTLIGKVLWFSTDKEPRTNTMPDWIKFPSEAAQAKLIAAYKPENGPVPATNNITTFAVSRKNGAMMGQLRSFVSPQGKPIGNPGMPSMHGGMVDDEDFDEGIASISREDSEVARVLATLREIREEFGVSLDPEDIEYLGTVYDPDNRRHNYVHNVLVPYEEALIRTYMKNIPNLAQLPPSLRKDIENAFRAGIDAILNCEGLGRMTNMFKPDLDRAMEIGAITPISIAILKAFPQLAPPEKPLDTSENAEA